MKGRILVISRNAWNNSNSTGNTATNFFQTGMIGSLLIYFVVQKYLITIFANSILGYQKAI